MKTIKDSYENNFEINKSTFIAYSFPICDLETFEKRLSEIKREHRKATHFCYAIILSSPQTEKAVDDGEPQGTAGKPILQVLKKQQLINIAVVVVRYFGGVKLGRGGLLRAYVKSTAECLKKCEIKES